MTTSPSTAYAPSHGGYPGTVEDPDQTLWEETEYGQDDDDDECEGHESLNGADMGVTVYCDGNCR